MSAPVPGSAPLPPAIGSVALVPWHRRVLLRLGRALTRLLFGRDPTAELLADRERLTTELSRRLGELYSLQELAHILSASLRFDRVVAEVARYAMRALDASGAVVLLATQDGGAFEIVAAKGVLAPHLHRHIDPDSGGLALEAIGRERVELRAGGESPIALCHGIAARSAVAAPLRAHGVAAGAIAVVDKLVGDFTSGDAHLLSTAATHAAVVLANARLFDLVRVGKEQWETTFDSLAQGIALVSADAVVRRANNAIATLLGKSVLHVIGRDLDDLLFGERGPVARLLAVPASAGRPQPLVRRSETLGRILRIMASPLPSPRPEAAAVVVVEDITEQKALEAQLLQSEKLASVGTLVSGVAHELNNPLTSIAGLSEFLVEQGAAGAVAREHLKVINDQAERASRIVRNLLSFARKNPTETAPVDLGDVAQRTLGLMAYELRRSGIDLETVIAPQLPPVLGHRDELQQVALNLLSNAAYAVGQLPEGSPRRIAVAVAAEGDRVVLRVSDSGPGIAPEVAAQIFDPFYTTKPPGEGTGLGLFLSYGIAEAHGGTLTLQSEPGRGATFSLALPGTGGAPSAAPAAEETERAAPPPPAAPARRRRILVVDEDAAMRRLAAVLFTHDGHVVDEAATGAEALALALGKEYDLVIADRRAAAGAESFVAALRRERPAWAGRVIVSSSATTPEEAEGAPRTLKKPFALGDLRGAAVDVWAAAR